MRIWGFTSSRGEIPGGVLLRPRVHWRREDGRDLPALVWTPRGTWRMLSSGVLGGGLGTRSFVVNAQVDGDYRRTDPATHLASLARGARARGAGVGLMTAADVTRARLSGDGGVEALATAGVGRPTWAADDEELDEARLAYPLSGPAPGTVNTIVAVPVPLTDSALVNLVATVTEAKVQALMEAGFACTGTASDAVCVACPDTDARSAPDPFGGPRSRWGGRAARAVRAAVLEGALDDGGGR
ncbi:adenosylcobinamide amidohydrolase [Nocardiopsis coralliicola]